MNLLKTLWGKRFVRIMTAYIMIIALFVGGAAVWKQFDPAADDEWMMNAGGVTVETGDYPACDWENIPGRYEGDAIANAYTAAMLVASLGLLEEKWEISAVGYSEEEEWVLLRYCFNPPPTEFYDEEERYVFERETGRFIGKDIVWH